MPKWLMRLLGGRLSEGERELIQTLRANGVKQVEVSDRGVVMCPPEEVLASEKYRKQCQLAREVVR